MNRPWGVLLLCFVGLATACTASPEQVSLPEAPYAKLPLESFKEFELHRADPGLSAPWSARFKRASTSTQWKIVSLQPGPNELVDTQANSTWIQHFLDTFKTFKVLPYTLKANDEALGLAPAWDFVRIPGVLEFSLGHRLDQPAHSRITKIGEHVLVGEGATLSMLELLRTPQMLREKRLVTLDLDALDEWKCLVQGELRLHAERRSDGWIALPQVKGKKKLPSTIDAWIEGVFHLQIEEFIEEPTRLVSLRALLKTTKPWVQWTWIPRVGGTIELKAYRVQNQWIATSSDRPGALFKLYEESRKLLSIPRR